MKTASQNPPARQQKIPRGFVMVNLSIDEQKELRELARRAGMELRNALRNALFDLRITLREEAVFRQKTGLLRRDWVKKVGYSTELN